MSGVLNNVNARRIYACWLKSLPDGCANGATWRYQNLVAEVLWRYAEVHRSFHVINHVVDGLDRLESLDLAPWRVNKIAFEFIYHDVIYDPERHDNEARSRALLQAHLTELGCHPRTIAGSGRLIMATRHAGNSLQSIEEKLIVDVDLATLGTSWSVFERNTEKIRAEYSVAEGFTQEKWVAGRMAFLESMLKRPYIYNTNLFRKMFEAQARHNMRRSIRKFVQHGAPEPERIF